MWNSILDNEIAYMESYAGLSGVDVDKGADHREVTDICPAVRILRTGEGGELVGIQNPTSHNRTARQRIWMFDKPDITAESDFKASGAYDKINLLEKKVREVLAAWCWDNSGNTGDFEGYNYTMKITGSGFNEMSFLPAIASYFDVEITYFK